MNGREGLASAATKCWKVLQDEGPGCNPRSSPEVKYCSTASVSESLGDTLQHSEGGPIECLSAMGKHCPLAVQGLQVKQQHLFFSPTQKLRINVPLGWSPPVLPARGAKHHDPASQSSVPAHQHCGHGELSPPRGCR